MLSWDNKDSVFWITVIYTLFTTLIIKKSVFTLPGLIVMGVFLGFYSQWVTGKDTHIDALQIGQYASIVVFLFPICMLSNVMSVKEYIFRRSLLPSFLLATVCYLLQVLIMTLIMACTNTFSWFEASCFSTIVMATDSFAIYNIIHRIPEKLVFQNVVQGESILMVGMGLSYYRMFEEIHSEVDFHSTIFIFKSCKEILGGVFVSVAVSYIFNKFRAYLIELKSIFEAIIVVVCFYVCEVHLHVNGLIAVTILGIVLIVRYKSGSEERYNYRLVNMMSNYIVIVVCLLLGYMDYQNESLTLSSFLNILTIYGLHIIVRAVVLFTTNLICRNTSYEIPRQQILLSIFGSMKGVNNIIILFFTLNQTAKEVTFKLYLIRFTVHIIIINNLMSNFVLYKFQRFRPSSNQIFTFNKEPMAKMVGRIEEDIMMVKYDEVYADQGKLKEMTGWELITGYIGKIDAQVVQNSRFSRRSSSDGYSASLILTDQAFIEIRQAVLREFKKTIELHSNTKPMEHRLLKEFCEMSQQHPQHQIKLFRQLKQSFIPMKTMRIVYKFKYFPVFVFEVYKILCEEIEFCLNLSELYVDTLQNLIMMMNLTGQHAFSLQYRKKIIQQMRDQIESVQDYTLNIYQQLPDTINQILNIRTARIIISDISSSLHDPHRYGQLNDFSRQEFIKMFELQDAKLSNTNPSCQDLKAGTIVHRHKVFSCLTPEQITEMLSESVTVKIKSGKNIIGSIPVKEVYVIIKGSFSERIGDTCYNWKKKGQMLRIPYVCFDKFSWEESLIADSESELIAIPIQKVRYWMNRIPELQRRIYSKSIIYFIHNKPQKSGQLIYYPQKQLKNLMKDSKLVLFKNNQKVIIEFGAYVIYGELISDQSKKNSLQGVNRYDQFSYVPPGQRLICMRQSMVITFNSTIPHFAHYDI